MYAYEVFEKLKETAQSHIAQMGHTELIKRNVYMVFDSLENEEKFIRQDAYDTTMGLFACVACNDGKIKIKEYEAFNALVSCNSYDEFFNYMSKLNKQEKRDRAIELFKRVRIRRNVIGLISMCIAVALVDGDMNENEELFITSLCDIYLAQDRNGWYYQ